MPSVCVVRPDDGDTALKWGAENLRLMTLKYFQDAGWDIIDLYANQANTLQIRDSFPKVDYFSALGHGNATVYTAQKQIPVLWVGDSGTKQICAQMGVIGGNFLSCEVGKQLLPTLITYGLRCVAGYEEEFVFAIDNNTFPNSIAKPFFLCYAEMDKYIALDKNMGDAHKARLRKWEEEIPKMPTELQQYAIHDYNCDNIWGDTAFDPTNPQEPQRFKLSGVLNRQNNGIEAILTGKYTMEGEVTLQPITA